MSGTSAATAAARMAARAVRARNAEVERQGFMDKLEDAEARMEQNQKMDTMERYRQMNKTPWDSILGIGGTILGAGAGAILGPVTGGASVGMGAMLGASLGGGIGREVGGLASGRGYGGSMLAQGMSPLLSYMASSALQDKYSGGGGGMTGADAARAQNQAWTDQGYGRYWADYGNAGGPGW